MSHEELEEPTNVDNSEESTDTQNVDAESHEDEAPQEAQAQSSFDVGDPRFKSPEDLYKSYKELESKLGNHKEIEQKAKLTEARVKALAAQKNISFDEAERILEEETTALLKDHAPAIANKETDLEIRKMQLRIDRRELLDEYPESKEIIDRVVNLAERTGEAPRRIYERDFKPLIDKAMSNSNPQRPVRRVVESDERPNNQAKLYAERLEMARKAKPGDFNDAFEAALKAKHYGN